MNVKGVFESHQLKVKENFYVCAKNTKKDYNKFYSQNFWGSKKERLIYIVAMNLILIEGFNGILSRKYPKVISSNRVD